jgi:acyl-CoA reductase-like NAD-dependent aldehyde dehydrogenase
MGEMIPTPNIPQLVQNLRTSFDSGKTKPIAYRIRQLRRLHELLSKEGELIIEALRKDLGKVFMH